MDSEENKLRRAEINKNGLKNCNSACRPMLLHRMTLISFRLFRKTLDNLPEFFGQTVYSPLAKNCPFMPMGKAGIKA